MKNLDCFLRTAVFSLACTGLSIAVSVQDNVTDEGQSCFKITTGHATYYFQKAGGGFSSMVDKDGRDWIDFHTTGGAGGDWRGLPNLVYPGDLFHPGFDHCTSTLVSQSASKVVIRADTKDGKWSTQWEFYEDRADMSVLKADPTDKYWFLYEGAPGGTYDKNSDWYFHADKSAKTTCATTFEADLSPEWICFGDPALNRVLFMVHHQDDGLEDSHQDIQSGMACCAFGRGTSFLEEKHLTGTANTFSVGFYESADYNTVKMFLESGFAVPEEIVTSYTGLPDVIMSGETVNLNFTLTNNKTLPLNIFLFSDNLPAGASVTTASVKVNGSTIASSAYTYKTASLYTGCQTHVWIIQAPAAYGGANTISASGGTVEIAYSAGFSGTGSVKTEGYAWAGKLGAQTGPLDNAVFDVTAGKTVEVRFPGGCFSDDFNDGNANGWTVGAGSWSVVSQKYQNPASGKTSTWAGDGNWTDYTYSADITPLSGANACDVWLIFRVQDASNFYLFTMYGGKGSLWKLVNNSFTKLKDGNGAVTFSNNNTYSMRAEVTGTSLKLYANNTLVASGTDNTFSQGKVGFGSDAAQGNFDNAAVNWPGCSTFLDQPERVPPVHRSRIAFASHPVVEKAIMRFNLPQPVYTTVKILSITGETVAELLARELPAGSHQVTWDAGSQAPGIYCCRISQGGQSETRRLIVVK